MNYQLICLDLDGTLLDDQKKILPRARESVKQAAEQGTRSHWSPEECRRQWIRSKRNLEFRVSKRATRVLTF